MVVYRVEHPASRLGMYFAKSVAASEMQSDARHPSPYSDQRLRNDLALKDLAGDSIFYPFDKACKFGFASKKQMREWVFKDEWKQKLADQGLIVAKYLVPKDKVAIGRSQAVYHPDHAKLVATMSPTKI